MEKARYWITVLAAAAAETLEEYPQIPEAATLRRTGNKSWT